MVVSMFLTNRYRIALLAVVLAAGCGVQGSESTPAPESQATHLANAGVLVAHGDTKIVFDPLYRNDYGTYRLLPDSLERALFAGDPPFDGIDAVLVSHYHGDHFSAVDILRLLQEHPEMHLYAPAQAVAEMREIADEARDEIFERVTSIDLDYKESPVTIESGPLVVEAVRIPHSGWPERRLDVENIAFRVTLDDETTVLHLGDADTKDVHFEGDASFWAARPADMAFPPYWYFDSEDGRTVLEERLKPRSAVGVHVPVEMPSDVAERPAAFQNRDLFTKPGETRSIPE